MFGDLIFIIVGYFIGSVSSAIIISKVMKLADPRSYGSRNPGATNVLRSGNKTAAILVLVADIVKGILPIGLASIFGVSGLALVGLATVLGHVFPFFYKFHGGRGVATSFGVIFALSWPLAITAVVIWGAVAYFLKYSSLAAIISTACVMLFSLFFTPTPYHLPIMLIGIIIIARHYENIMRLIKGTENKISKD